MPNWRKIILSGSTANLNSLTVSNGITGSLFGTASWAISSSHSITASYVTTLPQNIIISGSLYITGSILNVDTIQFNTASSANLTVGGIQYDDGDGGLHTILKGGNVDLQIGQENVVLVYNAEATTLNKGEVVYVSGSQGNRPSVKRAIATSDGYSATTLGIIRVITSLEIGIVNGLNTNGSLGGTAVWLSPTVAGAWTTTKPTAPGHTVLLGYVVRPSLTVGSIFVHISNGWELGELHDVKDLTTTGSFGDMLVKSGSIWINSKQLTGSYAITGSLTATSFTGSLYGTSSWAVSATTASLVNGNVNVSTATIGNTTYATVGTTVGAGTTSIYSVPNSTYSSIFVDYSINESTTNARAGTIQVISVGSNLNFTETTTMDIGNTNDISWYIYLSGADINFEIINAAGASWTIKFSSRQM